MPTLASSKARAAKTPSNVIENRCVASDLEMMSQDKQFVRVREWQRVEQHTIHNREHRRVCADAERQREQRYRGETRVLPQHAKSVTNVFEQRSHWLAPSAGSVVSPC